MLNENIQKLRKSKGLSQQELALKLNVVRQTVSKWNAGSRFPMLKCSLPWGRHLIPPSARFWEEPLPTKSLRTPKRSPKSLIIGRQLASMRDSRRRTVRLFFVVLGSATVLTLLVLGAIGGSYLDWDFSNPEYATAGTLIHGFEWIFVRLAPFALLASIAARSQHEKRV